MKIILKTFFMYVSIVSILFIVNNYEVDAVDLSTIQSQANSFITKGSTGSSEADTVATEAASTFTGLGQLLTYIGGGILVCVVAYMGILYIVSSPDKQAKLKEQLIGVAVSGVVIFGAYGIWKAAISIFSGI